MPNLTNRKIAEICLRAAAEHLSGIKNPPWDIEIYEGDPDATDGRFAARWRMVSEKEIVERLTWAIRVLDCAGYDIVKRTSDGETS